MQPINISCNSREKVYIIFFLEQLSSSIDFAEAENKTITLMDDQNSDYMKTCKRQDLKTVIFPYGFKFIKTVEPTRARGNSKSLIDYITNRSFPN